jgi:hypothetical protein
LCLLSAGGASVAVRDYQIKKDSKILKKLCLLSAGGASVAVE